MLLSFLQALSAVLLHFLQPLSHRRQTAVTAPLTQGSHFPHFAYSQRGDGSDPHADFDLLPGLGADADLHAAPPEKIALVSCVS